jgi:hypothetical protein
VRCDRRAPGRSRRRWPTPAEKWWDWT